ncbi:hypothetical protein [Sulfurimonas hydrogeniphila]|uniref:hypothetical protein n=1 Tax=Sulfurimonas hydrogeniphila TaxID=2509341 RepID=UPI00125FAA13|nr:hypothetical protein [Sulfurimonas hydrogeniphila]
MFAFIDQEMIKAVILLILTIYVFYGSLSLDGSKPSLLKVIHTIAITAIISIFVVAYNNKEDAIANTKAFLHKSVFVCKNSENLYRVSKKDGWSVDGYYFVKDSLMIRADGCERR